MPFFNPFLRANFRDFRSAVSRAFNDLYYHVALALLFRKSLHVG